MRENHSFFMKQALKQAHQAFEIDEVPIGSVVVNSSSEIIGRGYNQVEKIGCQIAHAEMLAIEQACKTKNDWRLDDCWLYVTLEPCLMCVGLAKLSRLAGIVYGAESKLFSYRLDIDTHLQLYNRNIVIIGGVEAQAALDLLQKFFKQKRNSS